MISDRCCNILSMVIVVVAGLFLGAGIAVKPIMDNYCHPCQSLQNSTLVAPKMFINNIGHTSNANNTINCVYKTRSNHYYTVIQPLENLTYKQCIRDSTIALIVLISISLCIMIMLLIGLSIYKIIKYKRDNYRSPYSSLYDDPFGR